MVKVEFEWEPRKKADHKRSYESHRKRFLKGDLERGWVPRYSFYTFESFEAYESNLQEQVRSLVSQEAESITPDLEKVRINFFGTGNYHHAARYCGFSNKEKLAFIGISIPLMMATPNALAGETEYLEMRRRLSIAHELRHHVDRSTIKREHRIIDNAPDPSMQEKIEYLLKVRTEGLAQFDPREKHYEIDILQGNLTLPFGPGLRLNKGNLERKTSQVDEFINFLNNPAPEVIRTPLSPGSNAYYVNDRAFSDWKINVNHLKEKNRICPYIQGNDIFSIIRKAEIKRLTSQDENPHEVNLKFASPDFFRGIINKVAGMLTFKEFYEFYHDCARSIGLNEDQMIIRPAHISFIDKAEREFKSPGDRLLEVIFS